MNATSWESFRGTRGWAWGKVRNVGMKGILKSAPPSLSTRIFQEKPDLRERESSQPCPSRNQNPHPFRRAKEGRDGRFLKKRSSTSALHPGGNPKRVLPRWKFTFQIQEGRTQSSHLLRGGETFQEQRGAAAAKKKGGENNIHKQSCGFPSPTVLLELPWITWE